ncbi:glycerol-3-phosphate 1-O-acyltransferase PlsY [Caproicibacterium lactatifermentans]|jgi:glycerol-3-phosphate acyltransferase PlsY|uniref:Glycerol-3-phosphate acyltransferase n=1 Tax=Caproicibacterium lactatifermentans TaxID=2666138 RepID=A0ABX6PXD4_9FIRM|nr:glycerol-3-phosphate 1-O-acyltransferase PlsY [Caproicibacterium lactatifermentans]ARP50263.1 acyl-phosphate glycerol 3-phosphate acyltransferase [Ruminococcaceae bacterium CPB6]QKO30913.1 glycerol-3-phosphate 1-O-acyltransferase PlsY [Caproicibacterium lactatifermentans]
MQYPVNFIVAIALSAIISYLLGSISFSIIFTKMFEKKDIRTMGSGNAGMTNVLRSAGIKPGLLTIFCDFGKGILSCFIGIQIFAALLGSGTELARYGVYIAGIACVLGHMFPFYFGFRGGKGVLTTAAVLLMIYPPLIAVDFSLFLVIAIISKYVSLGSVIAASTFPLWGWMFNYFLLFRTGQVSLTYMTITTLLLCFLSVCIDIRHRGNISRLIHGTEKKFSLHHGSH